MFGTIAFLSLTLLYSFGEPEDRSSLFSFGGRPPNPHPHDGHDLPPLSFLVSQFKLRAGKEFGEWQEKADKRNEAQLTRLWKCVERGKGCTPGGAERKVVLLGAFEFEGSYAGEMNGGESIW